MKQIILSLLFFAGFTICTAQEEFYQSGGGMTFSYGHATSNADNFNSVGLGFVLKSGFAFGIASQQLIDETKPQLYIGYLSKNREKNNYMRPHIQLSYMGSSYARIIAGNFGLSYLFNSAKNFPTSLNGVLSLNHVKYKQQENYYEASETEMMPVVGLMLNQAFFSNHTFTPVIGAGMARNLQHNTSSFSFSIALNINFGGRRMGV